MDMMEALRQAAVKVDDGHRFDAPRPSASAWAST